jgi:predicted dehydrogenase
MPFSFGVIGSGWRAEFFLRIARDLPEQFPLAGVVARNPDKRAELARG